MASGKRFPIEMRRHNGPRAVAIIMSTLLMTLCGPMSRPASAAEVSGALEVAAAQRFTVSGVVTAVDYASNTVTIKSGGQDVVVSITPTTLIEQHGETGSIADIRKGSKITASGTVSNGRKTALSITLK